MCKENNNIYKGLKYDMTEFVENDVFMKQWMTSQIEYLMCIIANIVSYMTIKQDKDVEIDAKHVNNILHNILY